MEERAALERQIELLQNLINKHKSIHGDAPRPGAEAGGPEASTSGRGRVHSGSRREVHAPHSQGSWKKTYSLKNRSPQTPEGHLTASTSSSSSSSTSSVSQTTDNRSGVESQDVKHSISLPQEKKSSPAKTATLSSGITHQVKERHLKNASGLTGAAAEENRSVILRKKESEASEHTDGKQDKTAQHKQSQDLQLRPESRQVVLPVKKESSEVPSLVKTSSQSSSHTQIKPSMTSKAITAKLTATTNTLAAVTSKTPQAASVPSRISTQTLSNSSSQCHTQAGASSLKKSKFTWVKSQNETVVESKQSISSPSRAGKALTVAPMPASKSGVFSGSPLCSVSKKTLGKKSLRKLSPITTAQKTSKYKWVSSAGAQPKTSRKSLSPQTSTTPQRSSEKRDIAKKHKTGSPTSPKFKKGPAGLSTGSTSGSRYRWKAKGQNTSAAVTGGATVARRKSAFHWTAERSSRGTKGGFLSSPTLPQRVSLPSSSPGSFKLRSRMKIIRKSPGSVGGSDRGFSAAKYSQRGRSFTPTRSPAGVRRTPTRELVSFGKHKLRRHSPSFSKTNPCFASAHFSPASQRVFRTRYKMVTCPNSSATHATHYNPALTWRAKRIQSARSFLQSRLRVPQDRHPSSAHHWRGDSVRWIRGSLYQVSANKLSRTAAANMSINRTGRSSSLQLSPASPRPSSTRHLASRAVQRSLAIIRNARQKKQPKQFCMYYNRFGKCNRGTSCPFIHDPDKVAVCTRFLRGTCKQADGTCPFSHKVAKEKMPVCSYFLKGICNNSNCPYSHVYVSRKAEVCGDFVKGYCPEGEKCKKKHTLVCPDFLKSGSCPRGSRCNLQHRQKVKRSSSSSSAPPTKRVCNKDLVKRPHLALTMPQDSGAATLTSKSSSLALPSFISLSSSPEEADAPDALPADTSQVKEKKLQIKPRL